jgi:hypothetical protein
MGHLRYWVTVIGIAVLLVSPLGAASTLYQVVGSSAAPGQEDIPLPIAAMFPIPTQGFSMAMHHECTKCTIRGASVKGTAAQVADFVTALVDPVAGTIVIGVLIDAEVPISGTLLPALEEPMIVLNLILNIASDTPLRDYRFSFIPEGLPSGSSWIFNSYAAENQSYPVNDLREGFLTVQRKPLNGLPLFIRGDANQDLRIDLADPVYLLWSLYGDYGVPPCIDAADANDSGMVDLADPIFLLSYCFNRGPPPDDFRERIGLDWTPDPWDCDNPAAGWLTDFWPDE